MQRIDIVRQQRAIPLLNELLFSVLDAKPADPLEYLVDVLERIATDVVSAKGRLAELVRSRKQLNETLTVARRHRKPVGLTLLLHASGSGGSGVGPGCHPILQEMYLNDACFRPAAPRPTAAGTATEAVAAEPPRSGAGVLLAPVERNATPVDRVDEQTTPSPAAVDHTGCEAKPAVEPAQEAAEPRASEDDVLSVRWAAQVSDALKSPMPTDAFHALHKCVTEREDRSCGGVEVLLVSAARSTDPFWSATVSPHRSRSVSPSKPVASLVVESPTRHRTTVHFPLLALLLPSGEEECSFPLLRSLTAPEVDAGVVVGNQQPTKTLIDRVLYAPLECLRLACEESSVAGVFGALALVFQSVATGSSDGSNTGEGGDAPQGGECDAENQQPANSCLQTVAAASQHHLPYLSLLVAASVSRGDDLGVEPVVCGSECGVDATTPHAPVSGHTNAVVRLLKPFVDSSPDAFPFLGRLVAMISSEAENERCAAGCYWPHLALLASISEEDLKHGHGDGEKQSGKRSLLRLVL